MPLAYDSLLDLARRTSAPKLADQVHELQGLDKERRELQARDAPPEVIPVMAVSILTLSVKILADLSLPEKRSRERSLSIPNQHLMELVSLFRIYAKI